MVRDYLKHLTEAVDYHDPAIVIVENAAGRTGW